MKKKLTELLSTPKRRLLAACGALGFTWIVLLLMFSGSLMDLVPGRSRIDAAKLELKKQQKLLDAALAEEKADKRLKQSYRAVIDAAWREKAHGGPETALRQRVSDAATKLGIKLSSLGTVRVSRINSEFYYAEIDVSMNGPYDEIIRFIAALNAGEPKLSWRRIDLRPDFRRQRVTATKTAGSTTAKNNGTNSNASSTGGARLMFSGAIRVIGYDGKINPDPHPERKVKK